MQSLLPSTHSRTETHNQHCAFKHVLIGLAVHEKTVAVCSETIAKL